MIQYTSMNARIWSRLGLSGAFGLAAMELAESDPRVMMLTADLCNFSGLDRFKAKYPDRIYNLGIAEQNMLNVAAGLAKEGFVPFATTYATFASMRCADQVKVSMGYMGLPVKLVGFTAGFAVGSLGATHMSLEDLSVMRSIPNLVILSPADCASAIKAVLAAAQCEHPVYIRMSGSIPTPSVYKEDFEFEIGRANLLRDGEDVSLIATGSMVAVALSAAEALAAQGVRAEVLDMHTVKPLDEAAVARACGKRLVVTLEEHGRIGGLGSAVAEVLARRGNHPKLLTIGTDDRYPHAGSYADLMAEAGLTAPAVAAKVLAAYNNEQQEERK